MNEPQDATDGDPCPGRGKCHGCLDWCDECGTVRHVCDARLDGKRCDEHPVPEPWAVIRAAKNAAAAKMKAASQMANEATKELQDARDKENARIAYDTQIEQMTADVMRPA